ncbi:hypothetical protein ACGFZJ_09310 [Streptomyces sp. NPDC048253]|uniref:hypothetical protein n=1 Tax=Streptomyces sp. NPDC048253 TaxID=3365524 RepID=UPI00371C650D
MVPLFQVFALAPAVGRCRDSRLAVVAVSGQKSADHDDESGGSVDDDLVVEHLYSFHCAADGVV